MGFRLVQDGSIDTEPSWINSEVLFKAAVVEHTGCMGQDGV